MSTPEKVPYPVGPAQVPENLSKPNAHYKRQAWLAMFGLLMFVVLYLALTTWFAGTAVAMFIQINDGAKNVVFLAIAGVSSGFLALFMIRALFFVKQGGQTDDLEVTAKDQPALFEFLYRLADEAGAPRPHRVYLSARVNAAVFYDLSLLNLFLPSRKNLEIGLPLVNVLTLSEFKAVLAHEFGHFGQRSMLVGRWVYIAQQIAAHIIAQRGRLDNFLRGLSNFDIRIAWVGWLLRLIVWSIRALLESVFDWVLMAQRALSRQMEFQADLVAVSLTGSDALIHALHKLQAADQAWDRTLSFVNSEIGQGHAVDDVLTIHSDVLQHLSKLLNDPEFAASPSLPVPASESPVTEGVEGVAKEAAVSETQAVLQQHRIFTADIAQPPKMWSTHPHNHEREENAKREYVWAELDERSAWDIFSDAASARRELSQHLLSNIENLKPKDINDSVAELTQQYAHEYYEQRYRGAYLGRSIVRQAATLDELYESYDVEDHLAETLTNKLQILYPEDLGDRLELLRNLQREKSLLQALRDGHYEAPGGVIRHRGDELKANQLPQAIEQLDAEIRDVQQVLSAHDKTCRSVHLCIAQQLDPAWADYLRGLLAVLHYADHQAANIQDVQGVMHNVLTIIWADRNVSRSELRRLLETNAEVYRVLQQPYTHAKELQLNSAILDAMKVESWEAQLGKFDLPPATENNINDWMNVIDNWLNHTANSCSSLADAALEELLRVERYVAEFWEQKTPLKPLPVIPQTPQTYESFVLGQERQRQTKLGWWDRFQTADGFFAGALRLTVSLSIVGATLFTGVAALLNY